MKLSWEMAEFVKLRPTQRRKKWRVEVIKNHGSTLPFVFGPSFKSRRRGNLERKEFLLYGTIVLLIPGGKADIVVSVDIF